MCLMTEKQTPYTDGEIEEENMLTEFLNESDRLYSPITVGKENKSTVTDNILLSDIGGYPDQQNKTVAFQLQRIPMQFSSELPEDYSFLNKGKQERDVEHMSDLENWTSERNERPVIVKSDVECSFCFTNILQLPSSTNKFMMTGLYLVMIYPIQEQEKEECIRQQFLMVLLIIILKNISGNMKGRQRSCRKYPCLNSILYLLWQSGDVEVNPGPPAKSTTYRNWLHDMCSVVRKAVAGVPAGCKMSNIWKKEPDNWPHGEIYFDPRNSKGLTVNKVEDFLQILINCCDDTSKLSHEITSELDTWNTHKSKDNDQLLHLVRTRKCCMSIEQVNKSLKVLQSNVLPDEILTVEVNPCIRISLSCQPASHQQFITRTIYRAEANRRIASFLGRILHDKDPEKKCDNIWTKKPDGWPSNLRYYNPNNGGERCDDNEDGMVVEALITLCENKSIILSKSYQDMVNAWQADNQTLLSKLLTRHTAETDLKKAVMKLHDEKLLQDQEVDKQLRELGLLVQCDRSTQNVKSQKRKIVNTMNKHETKRTKQSDHKDAVDTTLKELLPDCSIDQLFDIQSDSLLLDKISQNIPDFLGDEADYIQFH